MAGQHLTILELAVLDEVRHEGDKATLASIERSFAEAKAFVAFWAAPEREAAAEKERSRS